MLSIVKEWLLVPGRLRFQPIAVNEAVCGPVLRRLLPQTTPLPRPRVRSLLR
jgi:hypothetical protein